VTTVHQKFAVVIVLLALSGTLWAGYVAYRGGRIDLVRQAGRAMSVVLVLQATLGIALAVGGNRPADSLHFLYGPLLLAVLPLADLVARARPQQGRALVLAVAWLVTLALSLRAAGTGGGLS
jgi:hypothetical protein